MTNSERWFRGIFRGLRLLESEDSLAQHLADEDRRTEALLAAGPLSAKTVQHLYAQHDALGLVLRGRLHLEECLEAVIAKKFKYPDVLLHGRLSFSAKMDILRAANFVDEKTYRDLIGVSRLRNSFAHHLSSRLSLSDLGAFSGCTGLQAAASQVEAPEARAQIAVFLFRQIVLQLLLRLTVRHKLNPISRKAKLLPARARSALALHCAEHALQGVPVPDALAAQASLSLELGWRWVGGEDIRAFELYQPLDALPYNSMDFEKSSRERKALISAVDALYCITREALNVETVDFSGQEYHWVLTDLADGSGEEALKACLQEAQAASEDTKAEAHRQQEIQDRLVKDYGADDPQALGPPLTRAYFEPS